jgi:hypothetical protein
MNVVSPAPGTRTAASATAFPAAAHRLPAGLSLGALHEPAAAVGSSARDRALTGFLEVSSQVNRLFQAVGTLTGTAGAPADTADAPMPNLPPLAPMPAPKLAPAVPTDDHGQSNIVFSDGDADGALIH